MTGHLMLDLEGFELSKEEQELLAHPQVGGVILFSRNYDSPSQLFDLMQQIRNLPEKTLLIAVDQEGGRVQRFRQGFTQLPPVNALGRLYEQNPTDAKHLAFDMGWLLAAELRAYGLDFSFTPVLDLERGVSTVIGNRSFHCDPSVVTELAEALCKGLHEMGMASVGKHFPGHGSVVADSHTEIPIDDRPYEDILTQDILPFSQLITKGLLKGIMPAHIIYSQVDDKPAGFSTHWLSKVLRHELNFTGAIFSDDLTMAGASVVGDLSERAHQALTVGCDMILVCNNRKGAVQVIDSLGTQIRAESQQRLRQMSAGVHQYQPQQLFKLPRWKQVREELDKIH